MNTDADLQQDEGAFNLANFKMAAMIGITVFLLAITFGYLRQNNAPAISTVIVPHHDLVSEDRADYLSEVGRLTKPKTVVIVSTDHFLSGTRAVSTTTRTWKILNAEVNSDQEKIAKLLGHGAAFLDDNAFEREHGITNLLQDIHSGFPDAQVVPIMIKSDTDTAKVNLLANSLFEVCKGECLLMASVDFSHYQPGALAEIHDVVSLRALYELNESLAMEAETDSSLTLKLAIAWAKLNGTERFNLRTNTNSGKITNESTSESTSYVMALYERGVREKIPSSFSFMLGGDVMFGRLIHYNFRDNLQNSMVKLGERFFWGVDMSVVNLEGPISRQKLEPSKTDTSLIFNFPLETAQVLKNMHLKAVTLANNHSYNQGWYGFQTTKSILKENNILNFGDQYNFSETSILRKNLNGIETSILAVNLTDGEVDLTRKIHEEKQNSDFVLVVPHWGNEYEPTHSAHQQKLAHDWIDVGADLVVGHHPHVMQDAELYKGKPIFYSLGNLLFDQDFRPEVKKGLVLAGVVTKDKIKLVLLPTVSENFQPQLATGEERFNAIKTLKAGLGLETLADDYGYDIIEIPRT